ncbi:MAG: carboxymethylenebutenolidase [Actinomycetota bacterium]|jgi:carboxymethylenebutenolidase
MDTTTFEVETPDGPMPVYRAKPDEGPAKAAVIVIQEAFGVNDHIEDVTRRFAAEGYHAVAPHLFHRAGGGTAPYDDFSKVLPLFKGLDDGKILQDVDTLIDAFGQRGFVPQHIGLVGFCMGGRISFLVAARRKLGAAVGFYGGGIVTARFPQFPALVDEAATLQTPWLGLFGDTDESIPVEDVEQLRSALEAAPVAHEVVRYPGAGHGFHNDVRPAFEPAAAADGWERTLAWFASHLPG